MDCSNLTALAVRNPRPLSCQTLAAGSVRAGAGRGRGGARGRRGGASRHRPSPASGARCCGHRRGLRRCPWPWRAAAAAWGHLPSPPGAQGQVGGPGRPPSPVSLPERGGWGREGCLRVRRAAGAGPARHRVPEPRSPAAPSTRQSASAAACARRGCWTTAAGAAWRSRTARACTTRTCTRPATASGWTATAGEWPGLAGPGPSARRGGRAWLGLRGRARGRRGLRVPCLGSCSRSPRGLGPAALRGVGGPGSRPLSRAPQHLPERALGLHPDRVLRHLRHLRERPLRHLRREVLRLRRALLLRGGSGEAGARPGLGPPPCRP